MDDIRSAEIKVLVAADRWVHDIMREEKTLKAVEKNLVEAILYYLKLKKLESQIPNIPALDDIPADLLETLQYKKGEKSDAITPSEFPTTRYSEISTVPTENVKELSEKNDCSLRRDEDEK